MDSMMIHQTIPSKMTEKLLQKYEFSKVTGTE